jgi:hypothetical protein
MTFTIGAEARAERLLARMRETPMRRGALPARAQQTRTAMAETIGAAGVPPELARRVAFQLAFKFHRRDLEGVAVWEAMGAVLRREVESLRTRARLPEHNIIKVLPKLSSHDLDAFLAELTSADRRIARTILDAAIDAADPLAAGRRYLAEYRLVARRVHEIDPSMARTLANATFASSVPLRKAMEHIERVMAGTVRG